MSDIRPPLDRSDDGLDGYSYPASGPGVRTDLVDAVLAAWARLAPTGDPADTLRAVNDGRLNEVGNLARVTATAVAEAIEASAR